LQESAPFAEELFPDSVKMHPIYSKLVETAMKKSVLVKTQERIFCGNTG